MTQASRCSAACCHGSAPQLERLPSAEALLLPSADIALIWVRASVHGMTQSSRYGTPDCPHCREKCGIDASKSPRTESCAQGREHLFRALFLWNTAELLCCIVEVRNLEIV